MRYCYPACFALLLMLLIGISSANAQDVSAQRIPQTVRLDGIINLAEQEDFRVHLQNLEAPHPDGSSVRSHLMQVRQEAAKRFPRKNGLGGTVPAIAPNQPQHKAGNGNSQRTTATTASNPLLGKNFEGNPFNGSYPNDNTMAISDGGKIMSCINSLIFVYDLDTDTIQFQKSLGSFALPLFIGGSKFDPKVIYDPVMDRFILVMLNGSTPTSSKIIMGFSTTNDPGDDWNLYSVSGNPLSDTTWSDYPAITISDQELFITVNQIIPGEPWQTGFSQSIIWQIDKQKGFAGDSLLAADLWTGIKYNGRSIRNLNAVRGGSAPYSPNQFWLSNRNFDVQNDTVWIVEVTNTAASGEAALRIEIGITDVPYGVPPVAYQIDSNYFDTNDGRWLGSYYENGEVQFVGNCINPETGLAAIYHGTIEGIETSSPQIRGHIIADDTLELGYPNIVYTGTSSCDRESMIMFEHTSPWDFAGYSAVYYDNFGEYSGIQQVKAGDGYVDVGPGKYDRWGDYTGLQRKYNEPGRVWAAANYGQANHRNGTWISELIVPDSIPDFALTAPIYSLPDDEVLAYVNCNQSATIEGTGGYEPYTYEWSHGETTASTGLLCAGTYTVTVTDQTNCKRIDSVLVAGGPGLISSEVSLFPNPVADQLAIHFTLETDAIIEAGIFDMSGRLVRLLLDDRAKSGANLFTFSTLPLANGSYVLRIVNSETGEVILGETFIKQ